MIWEQRVKGIVMVTNCTEGGRVSPDENWRVFYCQILREALNLSHHEAFTFIANVLSNGDSLLLVLRVFVGFTVSTMT